MEIAGSSSFRNVMQLVTSYPCGLTPAHVTSDVINATELINA